MATLNKAQETGNLNNKSLPIKWDSLPFPTDDYRPRFFIELYREILNVNTPSSYQSRTMNVFSYVKEISDLINYYLSTGKNKSYIETSLKEFQEFIKYDFIATEIYSKEIEILNQFNNNLLSSDSEIYKLKILMKIFSEDKKKENYWHLIVNNLVNHICNSEDNLEQIARNLYKIENITKIFISYLLNEGFSNTYLFHRSEMLIRKNNYSSRTFKEHLEKTINGLNPFNIKNFKVYFLISIKDFKIIKNTINTILKDAKSINCFLQDLQKYNNNNYFKEFTKQFSENDSKTNKFYIISYDVKSSNYSNALIKAKEEFFLFLDMINLLVEVKFYSKALIELKSKTGNLYITTIDDYLYNNFYISTEEINLLNIGKKLNYNGEETLKNSLRYFRLAKESTSIEQKLLNTWIALETLYTESIKYNNDGTQSIIRNIIQFIPFIYNSFSIIRKFRYVKELLIINDIEITEDIRINLNIPLKKNFIKDLSDQQIWSIFKNQDLFVSLMKDSRNIKDLEHLKYRCTSMNNFISNKATCKLKTIESHFQETEKSISNQLYRLYSMRNKIAHQGHYTNINPQLVHHLMDYLLISYSAITIGSTYLPELETREKFSILDILNVYKFQFEIMKKRIIKEKDDITNNKLDYIEINESHIILSEL